MRNTRFEIEHQAHGFEKGVFDAQGIGTVPMVKLVRYLGTLDATRLKQVESAVQNWLGLTPVAK